MGAGRGGSGFSGTKGAPIDISDKKMYQDGKHFNKHGRDMGYSSTAEYAEAAKAFAQKYQDHPDAKVYEGKWNGRGNQRGEVQRIVTYDDKTVIINKNTGQIIDFYHGVEYRGLRDLECIR